MDEREIQRFIHDRFADLFLSQSRRAQSFLIVAMLLIALIWFQRTASVFALIWAVTAILVTGWRFVDTERFVRQGGRQSTTLRIGLVLLLNGIVMAVPMSAFPVLMEVERAALSLIVVATGTASAATTSGYRSVFLAFTLPMFAAMTVGWIWVGHLTGQWASNWGIALLAVLFQAFLLGFGRQANLLFEDSCRYRYGEQQHNRLLQEALDKADESSRAKTQFLAAASHDLRQPIHSMTVLVAALKLREAESGSREIVNLLDAVNQTMSKQLDSLLDISKLDAGIVAPRFQPLRLDTLLDAHRVTWAPVARDKGLALQVDVALGVGTISDEALLARILNNLTDNALKFTPEGGHVSVGLRRHEQMVEITVRDTGVGIPAHETERIFQEFYQLGNVERDRSKGLGLGLSIVRRLCHLLDIELTLHSTPGEGTLITLSLLLAEALDAPELRVPMEESPAGLVVLVVDDEAFVRQSMRLLLGQLGCQVLLAEGREQAVTMATHQHVDVLLSDYRLRDGQSGIETIRAVQAIRPQVRAALITGDTAPDRIRDAQTAGVPLLYKPVALDQLMGVLRRPVPQATDMPIKTTAGVPAS